VQHGLPAPQKEIPTIEQFVPRFLDQHARANQQKLSSINHKESMLRTHLIPRFGQKRLDEIRTQDVQDLKYALRDHAPKSINNVLTVLNTMLKKGIDWGVIDTMTCAVRLLKTSPAGFDFYDFAEFEQLVKGALQDSLERQLMVLLGGNAGLRSGELRALRWANVNFTGHQLRVECSDWRGQVSTTKGGRLRYVGLTPRLATALHQHRHLKGPLVLCQADGQPLTHNMLDHRIRSTAKAAGLRSRGPHTL
jgi:integrase